MIYGYPHISKTIELLGASLLRVGEAFFMPGFGC